MSHVIHSILKTSYFFDEVGEIGLLKLQYLRTTSETSLINLFLELLDRVAEEEAVHCEICLHSSSVAFAQRKIQLFLPACTIKYTILCWWIQHSAVIFVLKSKMMCCA